VYRDYVTIRSGTTTFQSTSLVSDRLLSAPQDYDDWLRHLKERVRTAQVRAALALLLKLIQTKQLSSAALVNYLGGTTWP